MTYRRPPAPITPEPAPAPRPDLPERSPEDDPRARVYAFVHERLQGGRPPSLREVQTAVGFRSVESARLHLDALVRQGKLEKRPGARGYQLPATEDTRRPVKLVPVLGRVQAGALTTAVEDREGELAVVGARADDELFALRVRGESMTGAGILPGDFVIVRRQAVAEAGDIVVALVDEEATVKRLVKRGRRTELHAEHPAFPPIVPAPGTLTLLGKVIEVRRYFGSRNT
jgi:repressor LexA